jgi:uncharacterized protein (TIGR04255 family)
MRTLPRQRLLRSPLLHVIAQVVYASPVYGIDQWLGTMQASMNGLGYADVTESHEQGVIFNTQGSPQATASEPRWDFLSVDRFWNVVVTRNLVALQTSAYDTFEDFIKRFDAVTQAILPTLSVTRIGRIGLRFVDRVECEIDETFDQYVDPAILGFPRSRQAALQAERLFARSDTLLRTPNGLLAVRSLEARGAELPPDLAISALQYRKVKPGGEPMLIIDLDHFRVETINVQTAHDLVPAFWLLHDGLDHAFRTIATPYALERWGQELIDNDD